MPVVRSLTLADCAFLAANDPQSGPKFSRYLAESEAGSRAALVAEIAGAPAGYVTVLWEPDYAPFRAAGIPEISDLWVLIEHRRRGAATALMDEAERLIAQRSPVAGLGVGLYADYGPAQVLYVRRGYVPDGRGLWRNDRQVLGGETIRIDDDVTLWLTRRLR